MCGARRMKILKRKLRHEKGTHRHAFAAIYTHSPGLTLAHPCKVAANYTGRMAVSVARFK